VRTGPVTGVQNGGYWVALLLFQLDPATPARPSRVACLFMIVKLSNVLSCRAECGFVNLMWDLGPGPHFVMDTALEAGSSVLCGEEDPLAE